MSQDLSKYLTTELDKIDWLHHGFFTRVYDARAEDRSGIAQDMGVTPDKLITVKQIHSAKVVHVQTPWGRAEAPEADALVTKIPGIALGVLTADCAPVLLACPERKVIGAVHAGWRGAVDGVIESTIRAMKDLGAESIQAALGPCIGPESYEVRMDFKTPFLAQDKENEIFFQDIENTEKVMFDFPGYVRERLKQSGITKIYHADHDTCADESRFFSHRRATKQGKKDEGRQISIIAIK